jgi:peptidoglycan/LPS O-acetylase OafA/YrhL
VKNRLQDLPKPTSPTTAGRHAVADPHAGVPASDRLLSLDGWRAISILLVLGAHCPRTAGYPKLLDPFFSFFDGDLGVRCFFVISGFLITWLLIRERDRNGGISLKRFYIRRALRILPVYFGFMAVLGLLHAFTPFDQSRPAWVANMTFTTNFVQPSWPSGHLWSLSVEEQFYLLWPVLFAAFTLVNRPHTAVALLCAPLLIAPFWRVVTYKKFYPQSLNVLFMHFSFFNYFDCLAVGCLCAMVLRHWREPANAWLVGRAKWVAFAGVTLVLLPYLLHPLHLPGRIYAGSTATFQAAGFALLLLQSVTSAGQLWYAPLNWKWVAHIGVLSYSMYIWQQIFCTKPEVFGWPNFWWMSFPGWLLSVLIVAHLSYYLFERPLFQLRSRFR